MRRVGYPSVDKTTSDARLRRTTRVKGVCGRSPSHTVASQRCDEVDPSVRRRIKDRIPRTAEVHFLGRIMHDACERSFDLPAYRGLASVAMYPVSRGSSLAGRPRIVAEVVARWYSSAKCYTSGRERGERKFSRGEQRRPERPTLVRREIVPCSRPDGTQNNVAYCRDGGVCRKRCDSRCATQYESASGAAPGASLVPPLALLLYSSTESVKLVSILI